MLPDDDITIVRKNAWNVIDEATARNVSNALNDAPPRRYSVAGIAVKLLQKLLNQWTVARVNLEQLVSDCVPQFGNSLVSFPIQPFKKYLSSQGIAIGMQTAGRQSNNRVPRLDCFAGKHA